MRAIRPAVCAGALAAFMAVGTPGYAQASRDCGATASQLVKWHNADRRSAGVPAMRTSLLLTSVATKHARAMAHARSLWHDQNLPNAVGAWRALGDNVGRGNTADDIHAAFLESSEHRANMLSPEYEIFGVGAALDDDGMLYVAVVFMSPLRPKARPHARIEADRSSHDRLIVPTFAVIRVASVARAVLPPTPRLESASVAMITVLSNLEDVPIPSPRFHRFRSG